MRHNATIFLASFLTTFVILAGSMFKSNEAFGQATETTLVIDKVNAVDAIFDENKLRDALAKYIGPSPGLGLKDKLDAVENSGKGFLKGLGGIHTQTFVAAARGKQNTNGKFAAENHVLTRMSGELIKPDYSFTMENQCTKFPGEKCGTLNKLVAITSIEISKLKMSDGTPLPPVRHVDFRFELKSTSKGVRVIKRDPGPFGNLFDGVIPFSGAMATRAFNLGLTRKLYVDGDNLEIVEVKKREWQTPPTSTPPDWNTIPPLSSSDPLMQVQTEDCVDILFAGDPPSSLTSNDSPLYCLGRCLSPLVVNTGF